MYTISKGPSQIVAKTRRGNTQDFCTWDGKRKGEKEITRGLVLESLKGFHWRKTRDLGLQNAKNSNDVCWTRSSPHRCGCVCDFHLAALPFYYITKQKIPLQDLRRSSNSRTRYAEWLAKTLIPTRWTGPAHLGNFLTSVFSYHVIISTFFSSLVVNSPPRPVFQTANLTSNKRNGHSSSHQHRHHHHHHQQSQQQPEILTRSQEELIKYVYESKFFFSLEPFSLSPYRSWPSAHAAGPQGRHTYGAGVSEPMGSLLAERCVMEASATLLLPWPRIDSLLDFSQDIDFERGENLFSYSQRPRDEFVFLV